MNAIDSIFNRLGFVRQATVEDIVKAEIAKVGAPIAALAGDYRYAMPDVSAPKSQADLYRRLSWVYSAIQITALTAATAAFNVKQISGEDTVDVPNHPFELLLRHPNPLQSRQEFLENTFASLRLTGNTYWWLNRPSGSMPAEIWLIPSWMIKPIPDANQYLAGYEYDTGASHMILPVDSIAHIKTINPMNPYIGLSAIEALAIAATGDLKMQAWNTAYFAENNAKLPGALALADAKPETDFERLRQDIKAQWGGVRRSGPMLLNGVGSGISWVPMGVSQKDMEFLAGRNFNKEEIYATLAPGLASMLAVNATEANAKTGKATFIDFAVYPIQVLVAEKITNDLLPLYGDNLIGEFDDIRITDRALQLQEIATYLQTHTIDEARKEFYEDEPLPDGEGERLPGSPGQSQSPMFSVPPQFGEIHEEPTPALPEPSENPEQDVEMKRWRRKSLAALSKGKTPDVPFESDYIPEELAIKLHDRLSKAVTEQDIKAAFVNLSNQQPAQDLLKADALQDLVAEIRRANDLIAQQPAPVLHINIPEIKMPAINVPATTPIVTVVPDNKQPPKTRKLIPVYGKDGRPREYISKIVED